MANQDFTSWSVWKKALTLLVEVYKLSGRFPKSETYGITGDIRRSANSITHNFAEGYGRYEKKDKTRFYKISRGSAFELISQAYVSFELMYISDEEKISLCYKAREIIDEANKLIKSVENRKIPPDSPQP